MTTVRADFLVVGSGQAGGPLSWRLARRGHQVVLFERALLGGTCVNYGCTPTKTLIASASAAHEAGRAPSLGVDTTVEVDMAAVADRVAGTVATWRRGVEKNVENAAPRLTLVREHARVVAPDAVEAGGTRYEAGTIILNVGARPVVPDLPGLEEGPWMDNADLLALRELPRHLLVLGGGYIGCELGQALGRLGARVTILDRSEHLLGREDPDVSEAIQDAFRDEGVTLRLGVEVERISRPSSDDGPDEVTLHLSDGTEVTGSHLLVAVGRRPNTDDLGLEAVGIETGEQGAVVVDDHYRTSVDGIYAVGDCTGGPQFTHASWDDHRILFDILAGEEGRRTRSDRLIPWAVYTDPQVGRVGLSETEARDRGIEHRVAILPFAAAARARETGRTRGLIKVLVAPDDRILGAAVVGAEGGELVHIFSVLMQAGAPVRVLVDAEMIHPAYAEGLQSAVMTLDEHALG